MAGEWYVEPGFKSYVLRIAGTVALNAENRDPSIDGDGWGDDVCLRGQNKPPPTVQEQYARQAGSREVAGPSIVKQDTYYYVDRKHGGKKATWPGYLPRRLSKKTS